MVLRVLLCILWQQLCRQGAAAAAAYSLTFCWFALPAVLAVMGTGWLILAAGVAHSIPYDG